ncbi:MAG: dependent oxidoreductase, partial [Rhizobium sp.]|nr:dependent oxidoreductase [Rhizobium sp.]
MKMSGRRVVIVGGGVMGSSTAYFLASRPGNRDEIFVLESDPTYARASSALSASGMRQQFSTPANIDLATFGADFLRRSPVALALDNEQPDVGFHEKGYFLIAGASGEQAMRDNHEIQLGRGARNILLQPDEIAKRFPWISLDGISLGCLGLAGEGWFDGYGLLQGFVRKAKALGCMYINAKAAGFLETDNRVKAVELTDGSQIDGDVFVLAAGCWSAPLAASVGIDLPVKPRLRNVFSFSCRSPIDNCPLVVDKSGVYFRPEGHEQFICGVSPDPDPDDMPLEVDYT